MTYMYEYDMKHWRYIDPNEKKFQKLFHHFNLLVMQAMFWLLP